MIEGEQCMLLAGSTTLVVLGKGLSLLLVSLNLFQQ